MTRHFYCYGGSSTPFSSDWGVRGYACADIPPLPLPEPKTGYGEAVGQSVVYDCSYVFGGDNTIYQWLQKNMNTPAYSLMQGNMVVNVAENMGIPAYTFCCVDCAVLICSAAS